MTYNVFRAWDVKPCSIYLSAKRPGSATSCSEQTTIQEAKVVGFDLRSSATRKTQSSPVQTSPMVDDDDDAVTECRMKQMNESTVI